jgi:hypothetical protein
MIIERPVDEKVFGDSSGYKDVGCLTFNPLTVPVG